MNEIKEFGYFCTLQLKAKFNLEFVLFLRKNKTDLISWFFQCIENCQYCCLVPFLLYYYKFIISFLCDEYYHSWNVFLKNGITQSPPPSISLVQVSPFFFLAVLIMTSIIILHIEIFPILSVAIVLFNRFFDMVEWWGYLL